MTLGPRGMTALMLAGLFAGTAPLAAQAPAQPPPATQEALPPAAAGASAVEVQWLADLGHESFTVREAATHHLRALGERARPFLERGIASADPEVRRRAQDLLGELATQNGTDREARDKAPRRTTVYGRPPLFDQRLLERALDREALQRHLAEMNQRMETLFEDLNQRLQPRVQSLLDGDFWQHLDPRGTHGHIEMWRDGERIFERSFGQPEATQPVLGVRIETVPDAFRAHLPLPEGAGLLVTEVLPDSAAARAGLVRHDILLAVGGQPLLGSEALTELLSTLPRDRDLDLELLRAGKPLHLPLRLGEPAEPPRFR